MQTVTEQLMIALYEGGYLRGNGNQMDDILEKYKEIEKQQTLLFAEEYDEYVFKCGSATMEEYYNETYGSKGNNERIVEATKTISYQKLDCPYDFTSRCTMGSCDCKPIKETTSFQTEISDEEIKNAALKEYNNNDYQYKHWEIDAWISACKWYREQLKSK